MVIIAVDLKSIQREGALRGLAPGTTFFHHLFWTRAIDSS